jgi:hypothetical protein
MFENPLDPVWLVAALAAVFGLASLVLTVDAVRRQYPGIVDVFGVLVLVLGPGRRGRVRGDRVTGVALGSGINELNPGEARNQSTGPALIGWWPRLTGRHQSTPTCPPGS